MFDIFAKLLSSIASFLFPLFASYKALKTSDPAQLTPWLMYWVVLACALLVESWTEWILVWIPFYAYIRLLFLLYLVLPQTQGARIIYQTHVHPWLEDNEGAIEDFIASAHERLRAAGIAYLKHAIELLKTNVLGMPPTPESSSASSASASYPSDPNAPPQSYTQTLLARFSLPAARWAGAGNLNAAAAAAGGGGSDFYNLLASAVSAATAATSATRGTAAPTDDNSSTKTLIPDSIRGATARRSFIAAQRERLAYVLSALDREATQLERDEAERLARAASISLDGAAAASGNNLSSLGGGLSSRSLSQGSIPGSLAKSRSEQDFEKLEAESGAEEDMEGSGGVRRRTPAATAASTSAGGSWMPWGWGGASTPVKEKEAVKEDGAGVAGKSSGVDDK